MVNIMATHEKEWIIIITMMTLVALRQYENRCDASLQIHPQPTATQTDFFRNEIPQEKRDDFKIPKDQTLVVRLPSNMLLKYTSYKDVSILHFRMPSDTRRAMFIFKAIEQSKSTFQRQCKPRDVSLYLKAGSYPVISPENITFPRNFLSADQRFKIYHLQLQSDEKEHCITVDGPQVGNWFAAAFVSWTDPKNDRIEQQGLAASCETLLFAEMSVSLFQPIIINNGQRHNSTLTTKRYHQNMTSMLKVKIQSANLQEHNNNQEKKPQLQSLDAVKNTHNSNTHDVERNEIRVNATAAAMDTPASLTRTYTDIYSAEKNINTSTNNGSIYKFYVPCHIGVATARITFDYECSNCPDVGFHIQANAFPSFGAQVQKNHKNNYVYSTIIKPNQTGEISIEFYVQPMTWHYSLLKFVSERDFATRNKTTESYHLPFVLQIDYHEPSGNNKNKATEKNSNKNKTTEMPSSQFRGMKFYSLLRQTYREFFMYDYDLVPDENGTVPTVLNLTAGMPAGFAFDVGEVYDIGGTLTFAVSMKLGNKTSNSETEKSMPPTTSTTERNSILAEKLNAGPQVNSDEEKSNRKSQTKNLSRGNQTIIVCMHLGEPGEPTWPDKCRYGRRLLPASSIVNNTASNTSTSLIHVPFPESGKWYVTMGLYCHGAETTSRATIIDSVKEFIRKYAHMLEYMRQQCACSTKLLRYMECINDSNCLNAMNEAEALKIKECLTDSKCISNHLEMTQKFEFHHKFATEQHCDLDNCSTSVVFTISSNPCVAGRCGRYGRCYHYMSGGFVFSTCVCIKGYRGWDCTEDSQVSSNISILMSFLLLTLSNLLFFPSIYVAGRRKFLTEAVIYFFAMFFSIFYHACDSGEEEYSFCLIKIGVLQFCDFYCGLLAIWVTLVAMSHIRQQFVSLLHMVGAILLAFGTELNKQSLWVFLAPALTGICLISACWGIRCYKSRKCFPDRKYIIIYMPLGIVLVMVGLVCYGFLQTKQNYHIVHSVWHMVMALSILCLLPSRKSFIPKC